MILMIVLAICDCVATCIQTTADLDVDLEPMNRLSSENAQLAPFCRIAR